MSRFHEELRTLEILLAHRVQANVGIGLFAVDGHSWCTIQPIARTPSDLPVDVVDVLQRLGYVRLVESDQSPLYLRKLA